MRYLLLTWMFISSAVAAAEPIGRLFTTPSERAMLDHLRQTRKIETVNVDQPQEIIQQAPVVPPQISVQGYVKRSDGKRGTVWINEQPVQENSNTGQMQVGKLSKDGNQVQIKIPGIDQSLRLKAGQTYDPESNTILESNVRAPKPDPQDSGTIGAATIEQH